MIPEIALRDWNHFLALVAQITIGHPTRVAYIARGQADARWLLKPSLGRILQAGQNLAAVHELERALLKDFLAQAHLHMADVHLGSQANILQKWAVMQHCGAPTRLLDWSASPYVAAYYAVDSAWDLDGAIWILHPHSLVNWAVESFPEFRGSGDFAQLLMSDTAPLAVMPWFSSSLTDRMTAQQGVFTVSINPLVEPITVLGELAKADNGSGELCRKVVIPAALKPIFLRNLRAMNITANALFPGVDGLGRSLTELARLSQLVTVAASIPLVASGS